MKRSKKDILIAYIAKYIIPNLDYASAQDDGVIIGRYRQSIGSRMICTLFICTEDDYNAASALYEEMEAQHIENQYLTDKLINEALNGQYDI